MIWNWVTLVVILGLMIGLAIWMFSNISKLGGDELERSFLFSSVLIGILLLWAVFLGGDLRYAVVSTIFLIVILSTHLWTLFAYSNEWGRRRRTLIRVGFSIIFASSILGVIVAVMNIHEPPEFPIYYGIVLNLLI